MEEIEAIGRYRLLRKLGSGGMGEVHLASSHGAAGFEKLVAVKILHQRLREHLESAEGLWREAMIGSQLDHESIVQVLDLGDEAGCYYLVMEYVRGYTLSAAISHCVSQGESYDLRSAVHVARRIAGALTYLHGLARPGGGPLKLCHADVSKSNVLLAVDGRVKLTDLGVATYESQVDTPTSLAGKLSYLPLEAFEAAPRTRGWDVYALAVTLFGTLAGRSVFPGKGFGEIQSAVAKGPPSLRSLRPDCPEPLAELLESVLRGDRDLLRAHLFRKALDEAFPRQVDDREHHAEYISRLFTSKSFIARNGELPQSQSASAIHPAFIEETEEVTVGKGERRRPLRFGISPAHGAALAREHANELVDLLSLRLDRRVSAAPFADYTSLEECLVNGDIDIAWMPPVSFARAAERGAGVVTAIERAGKPTYHSVLFVRADADIDELSDLAGKEFAWVDKQSASGYLFVAAELANRLGGDHELIGDEHFHGSHRAVCDAVLRGWAAAGATYAVLDDSGEITSTGYDELLPERASELRPLLFAGPIPSDNIAHRPSLPEGLLRRLRDVLDSLDGDRDGAKLLTEIFGADRMRCVDISHYQSVLDAVGRIQG